MTELTVVFDENNRRTAEPIPTDDACRMVREGKADHYFKRKHGRAKTYLGIRMKPTPPPPSSSEESPRSISRGEMQVNAFARAAQKFNLRRVTGHERAVMAKVDANEVEVKASVIVSGPGWLYRGKQQGYGISVQA